MPVVLCSITNCGEVRYQRGWCYRHYQRWRDHGDPLWERPPRITTCAFPGCNNPHDSRGYCSGHARLSRLGQELRPLRSYGGGPCSVVTCKRPSVARGWCAVHWSHWHQYGDPLHYEPPARCGSRKYTLNEAFFDEISSELQAYWLGFVSADGGIIRSGRTFALRVELAAKDRGHLLQLREDVGSNKPLVPHGRAFCLNLDSWRMVEALERLGVGPRKSTTLQAWEGPPELMRHYWRGMVDGDGCIHKVRTRPDWVIQLAGSQPSVTAYGEWARLMAGAKASPRRAKNDCWTFATTGTRMPQRLAIALYEKATVALPRKLHLAQSLIAMDYTAWHWRTLD
jgi:hypothetical protein